MATADVPTGRPRGAYAKTAARKAEIVQAAVAVFAARGYHGGSMREIARQLDLSLPTLVHHFPSKSDLLIEVLGSTDLVGVELMTTDAEERGFAPALLGLVRRNLERPELLRLLAVVAAEASTPDHPAHSWFTERYRRLAGYFAELLARDVDLGRVRGDRDPVLLARVVVAAWDGAQLQWLLDPEVDMVAVMREAVESTLGCAIDDGV